MRLAKCSPTSGPAPGLFSVQKTIVGGFRLAQSSSVYRSRGSCGTSIPNTFRMEALMAESEYIFKRRSTISSVMRSGEVTSHSRRLRRVIGLGLVTASRERSNSSGPPPACTLKVRLKSMKNAPVSNISLPARSGKYMPYSNAM